MPNVEFISNDKKGVYRAGHDKITFDAPISLIFLHDTLFYLTDDEIDFFFDDCFEALAENGILVTQFVEADFKINGEPINKKAFDHSAFSDISLSATIPEDNLPRFLSTTSLIKQANRAGMDLVSSMRVIYSYDQAETNFRVDKFLGFKK
tara:strand:- start:533 stop:982 length:450 start_codon:yes stop_codon:yes gene_type:complete